MHYYYQFFYFNYSLDGCSSAAHWYLYDSPKPYEERDVISLLTDVHEGDKIVIVGDPIILDKPTYERYYSYFIGDIKP